MCSVPSVCSRISRTARGPSPLRSALQQPRVLLVGAGEDLRRMGDQRDQVAHLRLHVGHRAQQPRRLRRLDDADMEADVGAAVLLEVLELVVHLRDQLVEAVELLRAPPLRRQQHRPGLDRDPVVEHRPGALVERLVVGFGQRRPLGDEGAAGPPALRDQVAALDQRGQRLPQGRAGDPQLLRQLPLRRQLRPRGQQSGADRATQALNRLLERARRLHRHEHRLKRRVALHATTVQPVRNPCAV